MTTKDQILIRILASVDAAFLPARRPTSRRWVVAHERRADYATCGLSIPLAGAGAGGGSRKQATLDADELAAEGLIAVTKSTGRAAGFKLTDAGDYRARAMCGLPLLTMGLLAELGETEADPRNIDLNGLVWCHEFAIVDVNGAESQESRRILAGLADCYLPLLTRGWLMSNADAFGRAWYTVTPSGRVALAKPRRPKDLPKKTAEAAGLYMAMREVELARFDAMTPRDPGELGAVPLPVRPPIVRPGAAEAWAAMPMEEKA